MSKVWKRTWTTVDGEQHEAWVADYFAREKDGRRKRHIKTFPTQKAARSYLAQVTVNLGKGIHVPPSGSKTVAQAAADWLAYVEAEGRERSTVRQYRQHVNLHILPFLGGDTKLAELPAPHVEIFKNDLLKRRSRALARKVLVSLGSILRNARRLGDVAHNAAEGVTIGRDKRGKRKLKVGVDIPLPGEVSRIISAAQGGERALLVVAAFCGLRASELRGLRWADVDLARGKLTVSQRADRFNKIGRPKSEAGEREIPFGPMVANTLREWKLQCPKGKLDLVFPTAKGGISHHSNLVRDVVGPVQIAAGITTKDGEPKFGLHSLRHFFASWCINRKVDGGLELPLKEVQARLGHATLGMTADTYGHLFPRADSQSEIADAERVLFAVS